MMFKPLAYFYQIDLLSHCFNPFIIDKQATFKITLHVPSELIALSNMPIVEEKVNGNLKTVSYLESPIMSTYLVAVVVGLFDYVEDHTTDGKIINLNFLCILRALLVIEWIYILKGVKVRVYCQVGKANQGKFALHVAVKTLDLYKEYVNSHGIISFCYDTFFIYINNCAIFCRYFDVPYSLPKLDMVAIPDFPGAMENYGLVTYGETALLYDDQHSAAANKQMVICISGHFQKHNLRS